jgi:hypothetical protein
MLLIGVKSPLAVAWRFNLFWKFGGIPFYNEACIKFGEMICEGRP